MPRSLAAFLALAFVFAFAPPSMAQSAIGPGGVFGQPGQAGTQKATNLNTSRSNVCSQGRSQEGFSGAGHDGQIQQVQHVRPGDDGQIEQVQYVRLNGRQIAGMGRRGRRPPWLARQAAPPRLDDFSR